MFSPAMPGIEYILTNAGTADSGKGVPFLPAAQGIKSWHRQSTGSVELW